MSTKYQGASRRRQKAVVSATEKKTSTRTGWMKVEDGRNVFRIAPPHDIEEVSLQPYRTSWLKAKKPIYKDGEATGEFEVGNRKTVSALIHHEELGKLGANGDPVELYVKMAIELANDQDLKDKERDKFLAPIFGSGNGKNFVGGIAPKTAYLAYVWDLDGTLGKLELKQTWQRDMNRVVDKMEEADGEPIEIDPFTNPVEGYPLVITKYLDDSGRVKYDIEADQPNSRRKESWEDFFKRTAVTDEQLDHFSKVPPLAKNYKNGYSMEDFDAQLDALQRIEEKSGFGILDSEEFQEAIANILDILKAGTPDENDEVEYADEKPAPKAKASKPKAKVETKVEVKKVAPAKKKAPAKKVAKKKTGPTAEEMTSKIEVFITEVYGEEYIPQIPRTEAELKAWFETVLAEEAEGDLPLVHPDDFEAPVETEPATEPEVEETEGEEVDDDGQEELRAQLAKLRANRR